jgi:peroxiredoxin
MRSKKLQAIKENILAPDFELEDTNGRLVRLSDYHGKGPVVLALLRGFV